MQKTDLLPRHCVKKRSNVHNYQLYHFIFFTITLLGLLSLVLNVGTNLIQSRIPLSGTIPEILFILLGLLLFIKFNPWETVHCYFYDDKLEFTHGELDHSVDTLFFEHIVQISYERRLIETHDGELSFDRIIFLYEEEEVHLSPEGWPDDLHRLIHSYANENNIPLYIEEELEKRYKVNA